MGFSQTKSSNVDEDVVESEVMEGEGLLDGIKNQFPDNEFEAELESVVVYDGE